MANLIICSIEGFIMKTKWLTELPIHCQNKNNEIPNITQSIVYKHFKTGL